MSTPAEVCGDRLRVVRESRGLTQTDLADRLGLTQPAISQWENGTKTPARLTQIRVADVLDADRLWLFAEII
jgi:transcriptional regulator with XRE-family HTH domain